MMQTGYYILQAHSQRSNISLSHNGSVTKKVEGHNIGILQFFNGAFEHSFSIAKLSHYDLDILDSLIAVTIYDDKGNE